MDELLKKKSTNNLNHQFLLLKSLVFPRFTIQDHQPAFRRALRAEALVVGQGALHIFQRFQVLRIGVVRGFQVDSVLQIPGFLNMGTDGMEVFFFVFLNSFLVFFKSK